MEKVLTIALPVYNRTDYFRTALESALNQTVKCSVLVIDNNSPHDDFKTIVDSYKNPLIKYVKTDNTVPQDENFNNSFRFADTPWVSILHDDDMLHCQFVELTKKAMDRFGDKFGGMAVHNHVSEVEWADADKNIELSDDMKLVKEPFFYFAQLTPFPGVVLDKEKALEIGGFNAELFPIADFDFWYRYSIRNNVIFVNQIMSYYRISPSQSTNRLIDAMINNVYEYRMKLIKAGKNNKFLCKLALEQSRLNNIKFFKEMYPNHPLPDDIVNKGALNRAKVLFSLPMTTRAIRKYRRDISFEEI